MPEEDLVEEVNISKKISEKRDVEIMNRSSKMLSDINEVTEKCSSDEIEQTMSKDYFEFKDGRQQSALNSVNSSKIISNLDVSKKSPRKETSIHTEERGKKLKRNQSQGLFKKGTIGSIL